MELKQLDTVYITSTERVKYLSSPKDDVSPKGLWSVAAIIGQDVLITRNQIVVLIPIADVLKAVDSHLDIIIDFLKGKDNGKGQGQAERPK
jgi:hypothetical protein